MDTQTPISLPRAFSPGPSLFPSVSICLFLLFFPHYPIIFPACLVFALLFCPLSSIFLPRYAPILYEMPFKKSKEERIRLTSGINGARTAHSRRQYLWTVLLLSLAERRPHSPDLPPPSCQCKKSLKILPATYYQTRPLRHFYFFLLILYI